MKAARKWIEFTKKSRSEKKQNAYKVFLVKSVEIARKKMTAKRKTV